MRRLCIYLTYDKQNIIDSYVGYMLKELKSCVDCLIVVCNMVEVVHGKEILERYADRIYYRENIGFDAGGFKDALCNYIGWERVLEYEELVLVNDSMFGPFRPMKNIFLEMEKRNVDFWGLAKHGTCEKNNRIVFYEHIQSFFITIRSKMLHDIFFREYWECLPFYSEFSEVVSNHEVKITTYFKNLGYTYDVLADTDNNDSRTNLQNNYSQYATICYELIKKRNFPFLKKQQIADNTLSLQTQENLRLALNYIDKETDYDINFIWDNIIRTLNIRDMQRSLHLQYIISPDRKIFIKEKTVAIIVYAEYREAIEFIIEYLNSFKENRNYIIRIFSKKDEILLDYKKHGLVGTKIFCDGLYDLVKLVKFDFVCVLHDVDVSSEVMPSCTGKSYFYSIWENLLKNVNHVQAILEKFEDETRLGFLAPPRPVFSEYFGDLGSRWNGKYKIIKEIIKRSEINCIISDDKPPFRITDNFWIRGDILRQLQKLKINDYKFLSYLWCYLAQDMGYYSGIVESNSYASMNEVNLHYYLECIASQMKRDYGDFHNFSEMKKYISFGAIQKFCNTYFPIYIYGAGNLARLYSDIVLNIEAYVVSDGQKKPDELNDIPVKFFSEIAVSEDCGFVVCLAGKPQVKVVDLLRKSGVKHYICVDYN